LESNGRFWVKGRRRTLIAAGLLAALAYVGIALLTDAERLRDALSQLGWRGCGAILGLSAVNYALRFCRWQSYLHRLGRNLPVGRHLLYYLSGFAFTVSPAKAGEAVRSVYLRDHGVTYAESIAALFVERLLDMMAIVMLAGLLVFDHPSFRPLLFAMSALVAIVLAGLSQPIVPRFVDRMSLRFHGRIARVLTALASLLRSSRRLLQPRILAAGMVLGLIAWGAEGVGFRIICQGLQVDGGIAPFVGIYAVAVLAGTAAFFLPAGIGGMEAAMTTLLVERGATLRVAIIATLLCRLATLWFAVLLGVGAASAIELSDRPLRGRVAP